MRAPLPDDQTGDSEDAEVTTEVLVAEVEDWTADEACRDCDLGPKQVVSMASD